MADDPKPEGLPAWRCTWCGWRSDWPHSSGGCPACASQRARRGPPPPPPAEVDTVAQEGED